MKYTLKQTALVVLFLSSLIGISQTKFEKGDWKDILENAQKNNKLIMVDLYFAGCAPCAQMDANVFPNDEVSSLLNTDFVAFKADIFKEDIGKKLSLKYGVTGFPTFLFLAPNGKTLDIISGYHSVDEFVAVINEVKQLNRNKEYKKYSTSLEGDYPQFYSDAYLKNKRKVSFETSDNYLRTQTDLGSEIPFVIMTGLRVGGQYADYVLDNAAVLAENYGRMQVRNNIATIVKRKAMLFGEKSEESAFNKVLEKAKPIFTKTEWERFHPGFQKAFLESKNQ
ncbi:thioredoxin family protein [Aestuariibaculum suncheonense]|uniref:Thioredoxin family protein n=1 Tax=Aestuariibaculum suncheonense TaxID=1028745 RepID=A0A8J6QJG1_9FLAO|nr:thioredoxin family protein [Aestuariibaculum suncheonense]MBD0836031.1 thioredoxin family protein [Aestuariibaculum suncheonense]